MALYSGPFQPASPALPLQPSATDGSARLCLALAASGDAAIAAGSAQGGVAVWDASTRRLVEEYSSQHGGSRVNVLSFVPLRTDWLYSAGDDGRLCLQVWGRAEHIVHLCAVAPAWRQCAACWRSGRLSRVVCCLPACQPASKAGRTRMPQILWVPPAFTVCRTAMELATQPQLHLPAGPQVWPRPRERHARRRTCHGADGQGGPYHAGRGHRRWAHRPAAELLSAGLGYAALGRAALGWGALRRAGQLPRLACLRTRAPCHAAAVPCLSLIRISCGVPLCRWRGTAV